MPDHLAGFPVSAPDPSALTTRIEKLSGIEVHAVPIPRVTHYPDVERVQLVAYHRLVRFRNLVDAVVGASNRFWMVHRDPTWARDFMDFQVTAEATLQSEYTQ